MSNRLSSLSTNVSYDQKGLPMPPESATSQYPDSPATARPRPPQPWELDERSRSRSPAPSRLQKNISSPKHVRAASGQVLAPSEPSQPSLAELKQQVAHRDQYGMPSPPLPPPALVAGYNSRSSSRDRGTGSRPQTPLSSSSRPQTPTLQLPGQSPITPSRSRAEEEKREKKKHWWTSSKKEQEPRGPPAYIAGHPEKPAYDSDGLLQGRPMRELWDDEDGNCYVYLFPRNSGKGASFKIDTSVFASSPTLTRMTFGDLYSNQAVMSGDRRAMPLDARMQGLSVNDPSTPPATPQRNITGQTTSSSSSRDSRGGYSLSDDGQNEAHLYLPLKLSTTAPQPVDPNVAAAQYDDLQTVVDYRNFFAFLTGQSLVATEKRSGFFHIFMTIASLLKAYDFSNLDGSTFGEVASSSFDQYVEEIGLNDVRASRDKTIESIVLGEKMKSVLLYNEAFTHAVGKLDDLVAMKSSKFTLISPTTQNRLTRASMDLEKRTASIRLILTDFDFPAIFSGIMNSRMSEERKEGVRFDGWKDAFLGFRRWYAGLLRHRYGAWPPKASSKKNDLETSGLNRLVLRDVYGDMSGMYDLLVDRVNLTTRTVDGINLAGDRETPPVRALRSVLSEYDRSSPPVKPPVPFDLPLLPSLKTSRPDFGTGDKKKDLKAIQKKLKDDEIAQIMRGSWNHDTIVTPFIDAYRAMEAKAAHGCTIAELVDLRQGWWIFMYAVLQALPMLACDAPSLKYTQGCEYFLCEPPRSGVPWADPAKAHAVQRNWYKLEGTGGVVSLPSDVIEHGVEGIYRRSHCWIMAEHWSASNPMLNAALHEKEAMDSENQPDVPDIGPPGIRFGGPLPAPPSPGAMLRPNSRSSSPSRESKRLSSLNFGLEALPLPAGVTPDGSAPVERPGSSHNVDSSKTFDAILADVNKGGSKKKR